MAIVSTLHTEQLRCVEKHPNRPLIQTKNETTDGRGRAKRGKKYIHEPEGKQRQESLTRERNEEQIGF